MDFVIPRFWLFITLAALAAILGSTLGPVYLWVLIPAFGALISDNELSIHIDAKKINISYLPPKAKTGEKGGA